MCVYVYIDIDVLCMGFPGGSDSKESSCNAGDLGLILGWEDPLEKGKTTGVGSLCQQLGNS